MAFVNWLVLSREWELLGLWLVMDWIIRQFSTNYSTSKLQLKLHLPAGPYREVLEIGLHIFTRQAIQMVVLQLLPSLHLAPQYDTSTIPPAWNQKRWVFAKLGYFHQALCLVRLWCTNPQQPCVHDWCKASLPKLCKTEIDKIFGEQNVNFGWLHNTVSVLDQTSSLSLGEVVSMQNVDDAWCAHIRTIQHLWKPSGTPCKSWCSGYLSSKLPILHSQGIKSYVYLPTLAGYIVATIFWLEVKCHCMRCFNQSILPPMQSLYPLT